MDHREAGRKGGNATFAKEGRPGMIARAKNGFAANVAKNWHGDKDGYLAHQRRLAHQAVTEALTDIQLRAELAKGKQIASVELGPDEDYEPQRWADRVRKREDSTVDLPW